MDMVLALALVAGVLVAVFVKVAEMVNQSWEALWWVAVLGWACYIAAGGKMNGVKRAAAAGLAGMFWVAAAEVSSMFTDIGLLWIFLGIAAFFIVIQSKLSWFSSIPAGLAGAAVIGSGGPVGIMDAVTNLRLAVVFVLGTVIGLVAEMIVGMLTKKA